MIRLYYWPRSTAVRVWWALEELGVEFEKYLVSKETKEHKTPAYMAINPNGQVPALTDDGVNLFESLAIIIHLGEKYGAAKGLWPEVRSAAADEALCWAVWGSVTLEPPTLAAAFHSRLSDLHYALPMEKRNSAIAEQAEIDIHKRMPLLEHKLAGRDFVLAGGFSLVDIVNCTICMRVVRCKIDLSAYPNVTAWMTRCTERPAFQRVLPET
jgi:glutathione S-transferase